MKIIKSKKRSYSEEFKLNAVSQVVNYQHKVLDVARVLELNPSQIYRWVKLYRKAVLGGTNEETLTVEQTRIQQLEAKVKRLEVEKEILMQLFGEVDIVDETSRSNYNLI